MDLVNEELVDLVHNGVGFLGPNLFRECGKLLHVTEEHRDLLTLPLNLSPLGQDFLGQSLGKVPLNFC